MWIIRNRKYIFTAIGAIMLASIGAIAVWGLKPGIEFTGGSLVEVAYPSGRPDKATLESSLTALHIGSFSLRPSGTDAYSLRTRPLTQEEQNTIEQTLKGAAIDTKVVKATKVGPVISEELTNKAFVAISLVILLIVLYVAFVFRKVSKPVSSWWYGLITIAVLVHDIVVPAGIFAIAGHFYGAEMDVLFVTALLTILGYSVNDTIVVFDRVREHLRNNLHDNIVEPFDELVGAAIIQTMGRSINTSLTVLIVVLVLLFMGGSTTTFFSLVLATGVIAGTYSSILLASPLLVTVERYLANKSKKV